MPRIDEQELIQFVWERFEHKKPTFQESLEVWTEIKKLADEMIDTIQQDLVDQKFKGMEID